MMDLEIADYERTIQALNFQISNKQKEIDELQVEVSRQKENVDGLQKQLCKLPHPPFDFDFIVTTSLQSKVCYGFTLLSAAAETQVTQSDERANKLKQVVMQTKKELSDIKKKVFINYRQDSNMSH